MNSHGIQNTICAVEPHQSEADGVCRADNPDMVMEIGTAANSAQVLDEVISTIRTASNMWLWRLVRWLAILDAAPEISFRCGNEVLIEWIGVDLDLDPFATAGNHRQDRISLYAPPAARTSAPLPPSRTTTAAELGFKHLAAVDPTVERPRHPPQRRMTPHICTSAIIFPVWAWYQRLYRFSVTRPN